MSNPDNEIKELEGNGRIPVLPLRDVVVYPHMVIPLFVGREKSIQALDTAMAKDKQILLVAQKSAEIDDPSMRDIHDVGTLSTILQLLKLPDGTIKVLVEGNKRAKVIAVYEDEEFFTADFSVLEDTGIDQVRELEVLARSIMGVFDQYVKLNKKIPPEILTSLAGIDDPARLSDTIAAHMSLKLDEKQKILSIIDVRERLEYLLSMIEAEIDLLQIEKRIRGRVKQQMEKGQREYYLNEQMKAIQKELGDMEDAPNMSSPASSTDGHADRQPDHSHTYDRARCRSRPTTSNDGCWPARRRSGCGWVWSIRSRPRSAPARVSTGC